MKQITLKNDWNKLIRNGHIWRITFI